MDSDDDDRTDAATHETDTVAGCCTRAISFAHQARLIARHAGDPATAARIDQALALLGAGPARADAAPAPRFDRSATIAEIRKRLPALAAKAADQSDAWLSGVLDHIRGTPAAPTEHPRDTMVKRQRAAHTNTSRKKETK